jgi:hypothetical protein
MLAWCLGLSWWRRQRRSWRNWRVVLKWRPSHWLFAILVDIKILCRSIKTHATELNSSSVHGMICRHHHGLLLFHDFPYEARRASCATRSSCSIRSIARYANSWSSSRRGIDRGIARVLRTCGGAGSGRCSRRMRCIWQLLEVRFGQLILGRCQRYRWL